MNFLDLFGDDFRHIDRFHETARREGPCEDDREETAPYIGILPDESEHEEGSPLNFSHSNFHTDIFGDRHFSKDTTDYTEADYEQALLTGW
jgi:hypothetical protein